MKRNDSFRSRACQALTDPILRQALPRATRIALAKRQETLSNINFQQLRNEARCIRLRIVEQLSDYVEKFASHAAHQGAHVHHCRNSESANAKVVEILRQQGAQKIVKSKSMVTEEIGLYERLKSLQFSVVETDLGEYIVSLAGEKPSHITAPAIHKTGEQVGRLFHDVLAAAFTDDPRMLAAIARERLRVAFLEAEAGITGANFAVADTGSVTLFTNEGNGRMCTVAPSLHIVVMTPEKIIPSIEDLDVFMRLLPASATGQTITAYLSIITGPCGGDTPALDGELHIIVVDNGRYEIAQTDYRDILTCIRCGACMNICPVYNVAGGHSYNSPYVGPMGVVLSNLIFGMDLHHELVDACTLCGACDEVCPVAIPLSRLIGRLRAQKTHRGLVPSSELLAMKILGNSFRYPGVYRFSQDILTFLSSVLGASNAGRAIFKRLPIRNGVPFNRRCIDEQ